MAFNNVIPVWIIINEQKTKELIYSEYVKWLNDTNDVPDHMKAHFGKVHVYRSIRNL